MVDALWRRLRALRGWQRLVVAFIAGCVATTALPPFHAVPALWIAFAALLWILEGCDTHRAAAAVGWSFGFGHFLTSLSWVADAFYVDAETFGALAIPAVVALTLAMGIFVAAIALATQMIAPAPDNAMPDERTARMAQRAILFAVAWMAVEWVRNWILTGWPWNPLATVWSEQRTPIGLALQQSVAVIGTFGLSLLTATAAALASVLGPAPRWRAAWSWTLAPVIAMVVIAVVGALHLRENPTTFVDDVALRLVQPNIPQADKWRPGMREIHLDDYIALSNTDRPPQTNVVIWGEASVAFFLDRDSTHRVAAARAAPANGVLIAGADRAESETRIFNSLFVVSPDGAIVATYDKFHLVPFGEFMPLRSLLPFDKLTAGGDFSAGPGLVTLNISGQVPGLPPFSPLICFEAIFPGAVVGGTRPAPQWLLNLTNDSWFGAATGPYQHFATARLRAIEEGLPLVRAADTGISAVVDAQGRVVASLGLNRRGVIDARLPQPTVSATPFSLFGNLISLGLATLLGWAALYLYRRSR